MPFANGDSILHFTRDSVKDCKGGWARKAEAIFNRLAHVRDVYVGDEPVTTFCLNGFVKNHGMTVIYIRKSSGGRWGRSREDYALVTLEEYQAAKVLRKMGCAV